MIPTIVWLTILFALLIIGVFINCAEDFEKYKNDCYDRDFYKCINCSKFECKYHVAAEQFEKLIKENRK